MKYLLFIVLAFLASQTAGAQSYYVYVNAESEDEVALVRFDGEQAEVAKTIEVGTWPNEIEGPHGIAVDLDGKHWYLTLAHGLPYGKLLKYETGTDELVGTVELGLYPATMQVSPATGLLYIVNFNLHGDHVPSTVSVVEPESMTEITRTETGIMPHGSRLSADGTRHYSVAMMSDELYEIDASTFEVLRTLNVHPHAEMAIAHHGEDGMEMHRKMHGQAENDKADEHNEGEHHEGEHDEGEHNESEHNEGEHHEGEHNEDAGDHEMEGEASGMDHERMMMRAKPTWAAPHPSQPFVYVANNGLDEIVEIDVEAWKPTRRFATKKAPYNLDISPDGKRLFVTHKGAASIGIIDLESGEYEAVIPSSRKVTHGVIVSPDGKYAFATAEGIGGEPGSVDIFDLDKLERVATVDIGKQAGGLAFWKMETD